MHSISRFGVWNVQLAATISVMKVDPVHAAFGEPDAEVYLSESKELLKAFVLMGDRQAVVCESLLIFFVSMQVEIRCSQRKMDAFLLTFHCMNINEKPSCFVYGRK